MNKNYYLISPKTDFFLIGGAALITYFLVLLINIPKSFDVVFWMFVLAFFVNSPHFIISYEIFYSSVGEKILKKKNFLFAGIVVPLILILMIFLGLAFYSKEVFVGMLLTMFFLVGWHYIKQAYGCFIVYSAGNRVFYNKVEQRLIKYSLYPLWFFSFLKIFTSTNFKEFWGLKYHFPALLLPFSSIMGILSLTGISVFLSIIFIRYWKSKELPNFTALIPILVIYVWLSPIFWNEIYFYMIPFFHSLQYFLFSGAYTKNRIKKSEMGMRGWLFWWGSAFILGALLFEFIPNVLDQFFFFGNDITPHLFLISFIFFINIHHYFIDSVIWKGDNPDVREYLKFEPNND